MKRDKAVFDTSMMWYSIGKVLAQDARLVYTDPNNKNLIFVVALWWSQWAKEFCTDQMQYGANVIFYFGR